MAPSPKARAQAFEDDKPDTPAEVMAALEKGLARWSQDEGIKVEGQGERTGFRK